MYHALPKFIKNLKDKLVLKMQWYVCMHCCLGQDKKTITKVKHHKQTTRRYLCAHKKCISKNIANKFSVNGNSLYCMGDNTNMDEDEDDDNNIKHKKS